MDIFNIDWMELLDVFFRAIVSLVTLFFVTKLLGKKERVELHGSIRRSVIFTLGESTPYWK